jgi:hypothetical protein
MSYYCYIKVQEYLDHKIYFKLTSFIFILKFSPKIFSLVQHHLLKKRHKKNTSTIIKNQNRHKKK